MEKLTKAKKRSTLKNPKCFISYSWENAENEEHKDWVRNLAEVLISKGVDVLLDQFDLGAGMDFIQYMNTSIRESDYVIIVCTPIYAEKANKGSGGAGYESTIINSEIFHKVNTPGKFVPIIRKGDHLTSLPTYLQSIVDIDFTDDIKFDQSLSVLLRHIHKAPLYVRPTIGPKPLLPPYNYTAVNKIKTLVSDSLNKERKTKPISKESKKIKRSYNANKDYDVNVFINCPFSESYKFILQVLVFAIADCGFRPRSILDVSQVNQSRSDYISTLISECKYGIHDISYAQQISRNVAPFFNVTFELGMFLGAMKFGTGIQKNKIILVLSQYSYNHQHQLFSDISGINIFQHSQDPHQLIKIIRNWLSTHSGKINIPSSNTIWSHYESFFEILPSITNKLKIPINKLEFTDYLTVLYEWLRTV